MQNSAVHCKGEHMVAHLSKPLDLCERRSSKEHCVETRSMYLAFDAVGLQYGPGYRTLVQMWGGAGNAMARLRARSTREGTQVHPADVDDALCTSGVIALNSGDGETRLPFALDSALLQDAARELWAVCRSRRANDVFATNWC